MVNRYSQSDIESELQSNQRKKQLLSIARLGLFLGLGATFIIGTTDQSWVLLIFLALLAIFFRIVLSFVKVQDQISLIKELKQIQQENASRSARDLSKFDPGMEFLDKVHPFANDLDLFGKHSLFQLLNHTVNQQGKTRLAEWMTRQMTPETAISRQAAIQELAGMSGFNEHFEGIGRAFLKGEKSKSLFFEWLNQKDQSVPWHSIAGIVGPFGGALILLLTFLGLVSSTWIGIWILIGIGLMSTLFLKMKRISDIMPLLSDLKTYKKWVELLENANFTNAYLLNLQNIFMTSDVRGSQVLRELEQKTFLLQNRINLMYLMANLFFWLDFALYQRAIRWKSKHGHLMAEWEGKFDEWQVLVSLSAFTRAENLSVLPTWKKASEINGKDLKHPLILPDRAIGNDLLLAANTKTILLTGSNMSGKTTFMRTLGINIVLANMGLGVFGKELEIGNFLLFTSMRNTDSLGESVSSFYAELDRIKRLLDMASDGQAVFYLLDEILKGTNTADRIMGSEALIRQLAESPCKGVISTHDIELSQLADQLPYVVNKSFHSEISEDTISFDFKLKNGPCPSFNAHKLMELMGIKFQ